MVTITAGSRDTSHSSLRRIHPRVCAGPKPSSLLNWSWNHSGGRGGRRPQAPPSPGSYPARSHGTAWHPLMIKEESFAGRETQTHPEFPPRSGCSKGQSAMLAPQQLPVLLN